jgi:CBS domain-containing protein
MIFVKDIMSRKIRTVSPEKTVREAAKLMSQFRTGSLVVVDEKKPVGVITEGDVSRAAGRGLNLEKTDVKSVMSRPVVTTSSDLRLEEAAKLMSNAGIKKLPVIDDGKLVGVVTQTDIVASSFDLVTSLKEMVRARYRPPDFQP